MRSRVVFIALLSAAMVVLAIPQIAAPEHHVERVEVYETEEGHQIAQEPSEVSWTPIPLLIFLGVTAVACGILRARQNQRGGGHVEAGQGLGGGSVHRTGVGGSDHPGDDAAVNTRGDNHG